MDNTMAERYENRRLAGMTSLDRNREFAIQQLREKYEARGRTGKRNPYPRGTLYKNMKDNDPRKKEVEDFVEAFRKEIDGDDSPG